MTACRLPIPRKMWIDCSIVKNWKEKQKLSFGITKTISFCNLLFCFILQYYFFLSMFSFSSIHVLQQKYCLIFTIAGDWRSAWLAQINQLGNGREQDKQALHTWDDAWLLLTPWSLLVLRSETHEHLKRQCQPPLQWGWSTAWAS